MCISCGCQVSDFDHGDADNLTEEALKGALTEEQLQRAADARGLTIEQVRANVEEARRSV